MISSNTQEKYNIWYAADATKIEGDAFGPYPVQGVIFEIAK